MKTDEVPQDNSSTYYGHKRLLYAQNNEGNYTSITSSGWQAEEQATLDAVNEYARLAEEAKKEVLSGKASTLFYFMYLKRMDLPLLAQTSGFFQWQVKRHFKPATLAKLSDQKLQRYADVLDISVEQLKSPL